MEKGGRPGRSAHGSSGGSSASGRKPGRASDRTSGRASGRSGRGSGASGLALGALIALGVVAIGLALAMRDGDSGLRAWWTLRADLRAAEARIERLRADVAALERHRGGLEADPFALERAIRERLEWARPGETLVRFPRADIASTRIP